MSETPVTLDLPIEQMEGRCNDYDWWQAMLKGEKPPIHENEPQCGYFKVRDRRGLNADKAAIKRPFIAAAIWKQDGEFHAEIAGEPVHMERAWPWLARHPITYETYHYWHTNERWPEEKSQ